MAGSVDESQDQEGGERCPICLEAMTGEAFLDPCFHRFCYHCILQWSELMLAAWLRKTGNRKRIAFLECPLCKTHYTSIIHDLVYGTKFQQHSLLAPDGSHQFRFSEAHRRRLAAYAVPKTDGISRTVVLGGLETRIGSAGLVKANKWLPNWVRRELQALMQDEDVNIVTHHVIGVVESLQKRYSRASIFRTLGRELCAENWCSAIAAAVRPFVFEDAEIFAVELWKFLDAGIDIEFYDKKSLHSPVRNGINKGQGVAAADASIVTLGLLDEDIEDG